ncbi:MAG TPA: AMP-binding protein [Thermoanaerobaculia bacterium]|nr:AMP-binding protein [Thermoanaerobaculia bacterium]
MLPIDVDSSIPVQLERRARDRADHLAFAFQKDSLTYGQLLEDAERIARQLLGEGVGAGDRVALHLPAGLDLVRLFYALQRIRAIPCIFDPHVPAATTAARIARIRPRKVLNELPRGGATSTLPKFVERPEGIAFLQLTSGTSGEPLAAMITQENLNASLLSSRELIDPSADDILAGWVPPWHDLGLLRFVLAPVFFGVPCHLIPPAVKTIPEWFETISRVKGTITGAPDFAWRLAMRLVDPATVDLRSLRFATNGGEPVRSSTIAAFEARFATPGVLRPGYGLAEATLGVAAVRDGEALRVDERGNVSCGKPMKHVEVRIDDGEILVKSPAVFAGYFDAASATEQALRGGWLHTGDVGSLDGDGNLYVLGRRRAMIKRGGAMLAPREIEEAVQLLPNVRVAAAVGVASELTEKIVVVVEVKEDVPSMEKLVAATVERTIGIAPDEVVVQKRGSIPRTSNGKIRHAVLRDQLAARSVRNRPSVVSDGDDKR